MQAAGVAATGSMGTCALPNGATESPWVRCSSHAYVSFGAIEAAIVAGRDNRTKSSCQNVHLLWCESNLGKRRLVLFVSFAAQKRRDHPQVTVPHHNLWYWGITNLLQQTKQALPAVLQPWPRPLGGWDWLRIVRCLQTLTAAGGLICVIRCGVAS